MKVVVFGAGAMGSMIGGLLSTEHDVALVGRRGHVEAIRERGLIIRGAVGGVFHPRAYESIDPISCADLVIITVKSYDTGVALEEVEGIGGCPPICLLQNGLKGYTSLQKRFGARGMVGLTTSGVTQLGPGEVQLAGKGDTVFGSPAGNAAYPALLADLFRSVGLQARTTLEIVPEIWMKAIVNASINPITALLRLPNGALTSPGLASLVREVVEEAVAVAEACRVRLPPCDPFEKTMEVVRSTHDNRSSMLQDILKGRRTEIEEINGEIVALGKERRVQTPVNATLVTLLRYLTCGAETMTDPDAPSERLITSVYDFWA